MINLIAKENLLIEKFSCYRFINEITQIINSNQHFRISIKNLIPSAKSIFGYNLLKI